MNIKLNAFCVFLFFISLKGSAQYVLEAKTVADPRVAGEHIGHHGGNGIDGDFAVSGAHYVNEGGVTWCGGV
ncbi:MAG: hypothetical protein GQ574_25195 [Crocinitomix sp.]|nr:hypothetical protein [Crocinitomix sp.]